MESRAPVLERPDREVLPRVIVRDGACDLEESGHAEIRALDDDALRKELSPVAQGIAEAVKSLGHETVAVGEFTGPAQLATSSGPVIPKTLTEELTKHGLSVKRVAPVGVKGEFDDAVAIGGWPMDDHPPGGFDRADLPPAVQVKTPIYNIPLRSLYSRNVANLMMAGRNISASHVAFTSTRVMAT